MATKSGSGSVAVDVGACEMLDISVGTVDGVIDDAVEGAMDGWADDEGTLASSPEGTATADCPSSSVMDRTKGEEVGLSNDEAGIGGGVGWYMGPSDEEVDEGGGVGWYKDLRPMFKSIATSLPEISSSLIRSASCLRSKKEGM